MQGIWVQWVDNIRSRWLSGRAESTVGLLDFTEPVLGGRSPEEVSREWGVRIEILFDGKRDPWRNAYSLLVHGRTKAVANFVGRFPLSDWF